MENIVYEKDYSGIYDRQKSAGEDELMNRIWKEIIESGFLASCDKALGAVPKVIIPEGKKNYEHLLARLDELAKSHGGRIRGEVDYEHWEAHITLDMRFLEFGDTDERGLLKEIAKCGSLVSITAPDAGHVRMDIMIDYFEELMSTKERRELLENETLKNQKLIELLEELGRRKEDAPSDE